MSDGKMTRKMTRKSVGKADEKNAAGKTGKAGKAGKGAQ